MHRHPALAHNLAALAWAYYQAYRDPTVDGVGAENRATASDQAFSPADLAVTARRPLSMIATVALRLAYLALARVPSWLTLLALSNAAKDELVGAQNRVTTQRAARQGHEGLISVFTASRPQRRPPRRAA